MTTASALQTIATALPVITSAAEASGLPIFAEIGVVGQALETIVAAFQAASTEQQTLAGITDPTQLDAAVEALLASAEALNKASHAS